MPAEKITLFDLEQRFGLQQVDDPCFFRNGKPICRS